MNTKEYTIRYTEEIVYEVKIVASSENEAINMVNEGNFTGEYAIDSEITDGPYVKK